MATESDADAGPSRALIIIAIVLAVATIGVILAIAATRQAPPRSVAVPAVPAPHADGAACRALTGALPQRLGDYQRATLEQPAPDAGRSTWYAVDRGVYVALTLPTGSGPTPIQQLSEVIDRSIPAAPIDPGPPR